MSCKGLVELIVLNVGLSAGILSPRVFSMFVLEALTLTFMTTPLVTALYPPERRVIATSGGAPPKTRDDECRDFDADRKSLVNEEQPWRHRFTVVLDRIEHMPCMMALTQLVRPPIPDFSSLTTDVSMSAASYPTPSKHKTPEVSISALRLIELSDRTSAVMKSSTADTLTHTDPLLGIFRMFGELNDLPVSTSLTIVPHDDLAYNVVDHAKRNASQLILLPWLPPCVGTAETSEGATLRRDKFDHNPFETIFGTSRDRSTSAVHSQFVRGVFAQSETDVALFVDPGNHLNTGAGTGGSHHIFFPFFGGPDDRLALEFVVQLCANPKINATVVKMEKREIGNTHIERPPSVYSDIKADTNSLALLHQHGLTTSSMIGFPDTVYGQANTQMRMQSETADSIIWTRYAGRNLSDSDIPGPLRAALSRINFTSLASPVPLHAAIQRASMCQRVLVVAGRSKRLAVEDHRAELKDLVEEHRVVGHEVISKTIGDVATAFVVSGCASAMVVLQAAANVGME